MSENGLASADGVLLATAPLSEPPAGAGDPVTPGIEALGAEPAGACPAGEEPPVPADDPAQLPDGVGLPDCDGAAVPGLGCVSEGAGEPDGRAGRDGEAVPGEVWVPEEVGSGEGAGSVPPGSEGDGAGEACVGVAEAVNDGSGVGLAEMVTEGSGVGIGTTGASDGGTDGEGWSEGRGSLDLRSPLL
jgi:hypothetical protein